VREAVAAYRVLLAAHRGHVVLTVALFGSFGLLEGLALLVLVPVIEGAVSDSAENSIAGRLLAGTFPGHDNLLTAALVLFFCFGAGAAIARWGAEMALLSLRNRVEELTRRQTALALLDTDWSRFITLRQGDIAKSLMVEGMQMSFGAQIYVAAMGAAVVGVVYLGTAAAISLEMTLITAAFGAIGAVAYFLAWTRLKKYSDRLSSTASELNERVGDIFGNLKFVRSAGATVAAGKEASEIFARFRRTYFYSQAYMPALRVSFEVAAAVFLVAFLYWRLVVVHDAIAPVLVFLIVFNRLIPRLMEVQNGFFGSAIYLSWYRSWKERLDFARSCPQPRYGASTPGFDGGLEFRHVSFSFEGAERGTLQNLDFVVRPGECVALVGGSGGGKSTLIDLVTGLVSPQSGDILLGGRPFSEVDVDKWRGRLGVVLQDSPLFHDTVFHNIVWGEEQRDRERATACARQAHAWEFIERLPQGLDTVIGQRGARLSGGQRQRIAIARALYRKPWLLILDEATSALDGESEAAIQSALEEMKGRTAVLMVAHRLKTVKLADRIYVLEHGRVVESGSWNELASKGGRFSAMVRGQAIDTEETETPNEEDRAVDVQRR
jgi:ABC-type multidrug transport system fused ATPase/permease subunit